MKETLCNNRILKYFYLFIHVLNHDGHRNSTLLHHRVLCRKIIFLRVGGGAWSFHTSSCATTAITFEKKKKNINFSREFITCSFGGFVEDLLYLLHWPPRHRPCQTLARSHLCHFLHNKLSREATGSKNDDVIPLCRHIWTLWCTMHVAVFVFLLHNYVCIQSLKK